MGVFHRSNEKSQDTLYKVKIDDIEYTIVRFTYGWRSFLKGYKHDKTGFMCGHCSQEEMNLAMEKHIQELTDRYIEQCLKNANEWQEKGFDLMAKTWFDIAEIGKLPDHYLDIIKL